MILAFSNVQTEYFSRIQNLFTEPVVQVYCLKETSYRRLSAGNTCARLWLRCLMYGYYPLLVFWKSFRAGSRDTLLVSSNTFFAPLLSAIASRRTRPRVIHWLYDLYPDALEVAGALRPNGVRAVLIGAIQRRTNQLCAGVVYLGDFLRAHGERRWGPARVATSIDIAADETKFALPDLRSDRQVVIHYGGQLGHMHDVESLAACVVASTTLNYNSLGFDFRISGAHRESFTKAIASIGLRVNAPVSSTEWRELIRDFSIGLVSLSPGGATVCLPSKTYAMMAGGLAIIAICPEWSDLAGLIRDSQCGIVVNNSPYDDKAALDGDDYLAKCYQKRPLQDIVIAFTQALNRLLDDRSLLRKMRENAVSASRREYGELALQTRWAEALKSCSKIK